MEAAKKKFMKRDYKSSVELYSQVLELDPRHAMCWSFKANAEKQLGLWTEALQDSLKAIELDPKVHFLTYIRIVKCHMHFGDFSSARKTAADYRDNFPNNWESMEPSFRMLLSMESYEAAAVKNFKRQHYSECLMECQAILSELKDCERIKTLHDACIHHLCNESARFESNAAGPSTSSTGAWNWKIATSTTKRRMDCHEDVAVAGLEPHLKKLRLFSEKKSKRIVLGTVPWTDPFEAPITGSKNDNMSPDSPKKLKLAGPAPLEDPMPLSRKRSYDIALLGKKMLTRTKSIFRTQSRSADITKEAPTIPAKKTPSTSHDQLVATVFHERREALRRESSKLRTCSAIETDV